MVRQGVVDKATGLSAAQAITAALLQRATTGQGQELEIQMLGIAIAFLWPDGMINHTMLDGGCPEPSVARTFRLTKTKDGHLAFALVTAARLKRLATGLEIAGAENLPDSGAIRDAGPVLRQAGRRFLAMYTADVVDLLLSWGIPAAPVVELEDLASHPQIRAGRHVDLFEHPVLGRIQQANPAVTFHAESARHLRPAPGIGEHSTEILGELGFSADAIDALIDTGAVCT
jgi:crotonobetainyl-CoA:carnitine CoA-transferase CaiB-like acyl-CoA transferase